MRRPERLDVAVPECEPHPLVPDERRIPHDEVRLRPLGLPRVDVPVDRHPRALVGHLLAGDRVHLHRLAVPARDRLAVLVAYQLGLAVPGQHGVAALDVLVVAQDRLGDGAVLPCVRKCHWR